MPKALAVLALLPACAVINAGGKDEGSCAEGMVQDLPPAPFTTQTVNTCGHEFSRASSLPCDDSFIVTVFRFFNPTPGLKRVCVNLPPPQQRGDFFLAGSACDNFGQCLGPDTCQTVNLDEGDHFITIPTTSSACGDITISVEPTGGTGTEVCLDAIDNDSNTQTDCEDTTCHEMPTCDGLIAPETCNGVDDGQVTGLPAGSVDELACRCRTDFGCDALIGVVGQTFVCHEAPMFDGGLCAHDCRTTAWCGAYGLTCNTSNGHCE